MISDGAIDRIADIVADKVAQRIRKPAFLGRHDLAKELGISVQTVDRLRSEGRLPAVKLNGRVLFDLADCVEALKS